MNLKIDQIKNRGEIARERIVFKVTNDLELGTFIVFKTDKFDDNSFSGNPEELFWFPDKIIKKDDVVVLYTKDKEEIERLNPSGNKSHFFYWGHEKALFSNQDKIVVLIEAKNWST